MRHGAAARARTLGRAGARFLDRSDPLRREAEAHLPATADLSPEMVRAVIDGMARDWTSERLAQLLAADLPHPEAIDRFVPSSGMGRVRGIAPALCFHVGSGTVPGVSATSMLRGLLLGSATLLKPGLGDVVLPVLLARAIAEESPGMAAALAVLYWPGGSDDPMENAALALADTVVVYGGDGTISRLRDRMPPTTPLIAYHHRMSIALVGRDALVEQELEHVADALARAVAMFDQRGCVSPHTVFVEPGGEVGAADLAAALARALARLDVTLPPTAPTPTLASSVHQLRRTAELRRASGEAVVVHAAPAAGWTVLLEPPEAIEPSCLGRTVRVHPIGDAMHLSELLAPVARHLQTVGVAGLGHRLDEVAGMLGAVGATRICPLSEVAFPPPWWHHDGKGPLSVLLRWVDLEGD